MREREVELASSPNKMKGPERNGEEEGYEL